MPRILNFKIIAILTIFIWGSNNSNGELLGHHSKIFFLKNEFTLSSINMEEKNNRIFAFNNVNDIQKLSYEQRLTLYNKEKKNRQNAMAMGFLLPGFGHYYANEPKRGVIFTLLEIVFIASAARAIQLEYGEEADFFGYLGSYGIAITHIWSGIDAGDATDRYNSKLRKKYNLTSKIFKKEEFKYKVSLNYCF